MTTQKQKFISDQRTKKKSEDFPKIIDGLGADSLKSILESQPSLLHKRDSNTGLTLLYHCVLNGNSQAAECLLEYDADPNITNSYGESILHQAVENGNHKIINLLLEKGANPNVQQESGETPMHVAASKGDYKVLKLLMLYKADPRIVTFEGYTALDYARERGFQKCIDVLTPVIQENRYDSSGIKTTKNNDSPLNRMKNQVDLMEDHLSRVLLSNNTARNSRNQAVKEQNMRMYSQNKESMQKFLTSSNTNINDLEDSYFSIGNQRANSKKLSLERDRYQFHNYSSYYNHQIEDQFNRHPGFETKPSPYPNMSLNSDIRLRNQSLDTASNHKTLSNDATSSKALHIEDKLNKQIKDFIGDLSKHYCDTEERDSEKGLNDNTGNFPNQVGLNQHRYSIEKNNTDENIGIEGPESAATNNKSSSNTVTSNATSSFVNFAAIANSQQNKGGTNQQRCDDKRNNDGDSPKEFGLNIEENRQLTLQPNDYEESEQSDNIVKRKNSEAKPGLTVSGGFTFNNIDVNTTPGEDIFNLPLQRSHPVCSNNPMKNSKYSFANEYCETMGEYWRQTENFTDKGKVLALFMSVKNDIIEIHKSTMIMINPLMKSNQLRNSNVKEQGDTGKKIEELFDFNCDEVNEYDHQDYDEENFTEEKPIYQEENNQQVHLSSHSKTDNTSPKKESSVKYFSKSNQVRDDYMKISIDTEKLDDEEAERMCQKSPEIEETIEYHSTEDCKDVANFLKSIGMEIYTSLLIKQGFDDVKLIIEQMTSGIGITDQNLRDVGISLPGHRARILIKFEEESKCFDYAFPTGAVYYKMGNKLTDFMSDHHVKCIQSWLSHLKMEQYTINFINGGYHSMELMLLQMASKNPITEKILEDEIKIAKIGYRIRILNKLKEDSKAFIHRLRTAGLNIESKKEANNDSCKCMVF